MANTSFGLTSGIKIQATISRTEVTLSQNIKTTVGTLTDEGAGLGGWNLNIHDSYDSTAQILDAGDGSIESATASVNSSITTFAGGGIGDGEPATTAAIAATYGSTGIATGPDGSLYIADTQNNRVRKIGVNGIITTIAGNGVAGFSGDGGPATLASLNQPWGVAVAADGTIYVADTHNNRIRRIDTGGIISTIAGNGIPGFTGDGGLATQASLSNPISVAIGPQNAVYFIDSGNQRVRSVSLDGVITTVAGNGTETFNGDGGPATQAGLGYPGGLAVGQDGNIYIADTLHSRIRRVDTEGTITTIAGNGIVGFSGDGNLATNAALDEPDGVTVGPDGNIYIVDTDNNRVRRVGVDGVITTVAGNGTAGFSGDGGPASEASFGLNGLSAIAAAPDGSIDIVDSGNRRIRRLGSGGVITTIAGNGTRAIRNEPE